MNEAILRVLGKRDESADTRSFMFEPADGMNWEAGQYLIMKLDCPGDDRKGIRSFSIASSPTEKIIMITTRLRSGSSFKQRLSTLTTGDEVRVTGPMGRFLFHHDERPALFIAGGIGVTPFRSILKHSIDTGRRTSTTLVVSDRTPELFVFRDEFNLWQKENSWLKVYRTVTRPEAGSEKWNGHTGRIDQSWITEICPQVAEATVYCAGPPTFVQSTIAMLRSMNIEQGHIRTERFTGY
ncbi:MAG: FAD-dependent oxidoreductase [Thermoplasmata archaeon]|jgi:ferredoxin-NADP reductase|nr:FAD-dependent oxidoreductase [Candidatus Sysuiplasma jiujiangense]MBX8641980.1 FAD-dependent oxidoreductase [Candidatus Sysuiplasma jiujiangense]